MSSEQVLLLQVLNATELPETLCELSSVISRISPGFGPAQPAQIALRVAS